MDTFSKLSINIHDLVDCFTNALDARELNTAHHSKRVADNVVILCSYLDLNDYERETVHLAAHLHDIGKIGVPDRILLKKDKLTSDEWVQMKKHPDIGADMISNISGMKRISELIRHHHERYDGTGYPDGLRGNHIPYGSRIIAICDSIDAMLSDRSYRNKFSKEHCFDEIKNNIEKMYDPAIGQIALEHFEELLKQYK